MAKLASTAIICGGGIGGLTTALALAKIGLTSTVVEKAPEIVEVGAGLQLTPNAMQVLTALGLEAEIDACAFEPKLATIRHYSSGRYYVKLPLRDTCRQRYGAGYYHIHRADLQNILKDAALKAGVTIELGQTARGYSQNPKNITLHADQDYTADVLIGADGIRSVIRDQIFGPKTPDFTGQVAWRGVIPTEQLPPGLVPPDACVWAGPGRHLVTYYVKSGSLLNFVAVQEQADWTDPSWTHQGDIDALRASFQDWNPEVTQLLDAATSCFVWGLFDRKPLPRWRDGRAVLLGDAAHPMLPFMAQGAAMAIEDAWVLSQALSERPVRGALRYFQKTRKPRTTMLQKISRDNAKLFHRRPGAGDIIQRVKLNLARSLPKAALRKLDKIYAVDVTKSSS